MKRLEVNIYTTQYIYDDIIDNFIYLYLKN